MDAALNLMDRQRIGGKIMDERKKEGRGDRCRMQLTGKYKDRDEIL